MIQLIRIAETCGIMEEEKNREVLVVILNLLKNTLMKSEAGLNSLQWETLMMMTMMMKTKTKMTFLVINFLNQEADFENEIQLINTSLGSLVASLLLSLVGQVCLNFTLVSFVRAKNQKFM